MSRVSGTQPDCPVPSSSPERLADITSGPPGPASFSPLAPGHRPPSPWRPPKAAAASWGPLSCHGPRAAPGARRGQPLRSGAASRMPGSGLDTRPPLQLSLKWQGLVNEASRRPAPTAVMLTEVPAPGWQRTHSARQRHRRPRERTRVDPTEACASSAVISTAIRQGNLLGLLTPGRLTRRWAFRTTGTRTEQEERELGKGRTSGAGGPRLSARGARGYTGRKGQLGKQGRASQST